MERLRILHAHFSGPEGKFPRIRHPLTPLTREYIVDAYRKDPASFQDSALYGKERILFCRHAMLLVNLLKPLSPAKPLLRRFRVCLYHHCCMIERILIIRRLPLCSQH